MLSKITVPLAVTAPWTVLVPRSLHRAPSKYEYFLYFLLDLFMHFL